MAFSSARRRTGSRCSTLVSINKLKPSELVAQAEVGSEGKRDVIIGIPIGAEGVGFVEHGVVQVGRLEEQYDLFALVEHFSVENGVGGLSRHVLDRGCPAQHFFDGGGQQAWVGDRLVPLVAVEQCLLGAAGGGRRDRTARPRRKL